MASSKSAQTRKSTVTGKQLLYCSFLVIPGVSLIPQGVQAFFYLMFLFWLFLGIAIIADIFMG